MTINEVWAGNSVFVINDDLGHSFEITATSFSSNKSTYTFSEIENIKINTMACGYNFIVTEGLTYQ